VVRETPGFTFTGLINTEETENANEGGKKSRMTARKETDKQRDAKQKRKT
jgi:hypothetical protein